MQPIILYTNTRHGYARIMKNGELQLSIPSHLRNNQKFYDELLGKGEKLLKRYQKKTQLITIDESYVLVFGESVNIQDVSESSKKVNSALKEILYEYAKPLLDKYSKELGIEYKMLKVRKTKSKWGSCTGHQIISLNQDLVHLPTRLIIYVVVHEACHLKIKNHSSKFRDLVEKHCPNYKILRKELRSFILH